MSATGIYKFIDGKLVKVSDEIPKIGFAASDICGPINKPYYDEHLESFITSRKQKSKIMKEEGIVEKDRVRGGINVEKKGGSTYVA